MLNNTAKAKSVPARFDGQVQSWGNSLGIRITRAIGQLAGLSKGDSVAIEVTEAGLLIIPKKTRSTLDFPYTEAELIAGITARTAHADEAPVLSPRELGD